MARAANPSYGRCSHVVVANYWCVPIVQQRLLLPCPAAFPPKKVAPDCLKSVAETDDDYDDEDDDEIEEPRSSSVANPQQPVVPRRKDLCKLLGLNENTVGDVLIVDDHQVKVAQKVSI